MTIWFASGIYNNNAFYSGRSFRAGNENDFIRQNCELRLNFCSFLYSFFSVETHEINGRFTRPSASRGRRVHLYQRMERLGN